MFSFEGTNPYNFLVMMRFGVTFVPIPNTAIKPKTADGT
jgi:hypothetical protein